MAKCSVIDDLTKEQFINFLQSHGDLIDFSRKEDKSSGNDKIFLGKVLEVGEVIRHRKRGQNFHDTLFVMTCSCQVNKEDKEFRIIFLGSIGTSLVEVGLKNDSLIAVLNPLSYTAFKIPSLVVGPKNPVVWVYRKTTQKQVHGIRKRAQQLKESVANNTASTYDNTRVLGIDSDDTDADPLYSPEEMIKTQNYRNKVQTNENRTEDSGSIVTNSSATFSASIQRDHKIYRSAPVNLKEICSLNQERLNGRNSASRSSIHNCPKNNNYHHNMNKGKTECFRTPQQCISNIHSQKSSIVSDKFVSCNKSIKVNNFMARTQNSHRNRCSQNAKCNSHYQSRHCCVSFENDCHCGYHQCNSYRPDYRSCFCYQSCENYNHCCTQQTYNCTNNYRSKRDCKTTSETNSDEVCSSSYWNSIPPHCSGVCRGMQQSGCRHLNNLPHCHAGFDCRQQCSAECCNFSSRVVCHSHHCTQNESALKSLEQLIERKSEHMNNREHLDCGEVDSPVETAKRTQNWVLKWTPSSPVKAYSLPDKFRGAHSTPISFSQRKKYTTFVSESIIISSSDSDSDTNELRKRLCTIREDLVDPNKNLVKTSQPNQTFYNLLKKIKDKEHKGKKKLFNVQDNFTIQSENSISQSHVNDENTLFNPKENDPGKSLGGKIIQAKPSIIEQSQNIGGRQNINTIESSSHQEDIRKTSHIGVSSNVQKYSNKVDHLIQTNSEIAADRNENSEVIVHSSLDENSTGTADNQTLISEEKSLSSKNLEKNNGENLIQSPKLPEPRLEFLNLKSIPLTTADVVDSTPSKFENHCDFELPSEDLTIINKNASSDQTGETMSPNKSVSSSDHTKTKLNEIGNNKGIEKMGNGIESNYIMHGKIIGKSNQTLRECSDHEKLICESRQQRPKRRRKRKSSMAVSRNSSDSEKSNETIDLGNTVTENVEGTISSQGTFYDAHSSCSQKSKLSPAEKWCLKPLYELQLDPKTTEAFLKMLPSSSKQRSYNLTQSSDFHVTGVIIGTLPDIIESPFSIVRGYCNDGCQKSYTHEEYSEMDELEYTCSFCRYRSHWVCPGCKKNGIRNPLCMHYSFEVHLFDGENVLRIEVENVDGVLLLGCTPTVYLKLCLKLIKMLQKVIVRTPTSDLDSVPLLKTTIKTTSKNGNIVLKFQNTSLKKNVVSGSGHPS